nr:hypothetical protein [Staphylococcus aureus]
MDKYGRSGKVTALITNKAVQSHSSKAQERPSFDYDVHVAGEYKDGTYNPEKQTWEGENSNNQILQLDGYRGYYIINLIRLPGHWAEIWKHII